MSRFTPGQSGNPGGRPKRLLFIFGHAAIIRLSSLTGWGLRRRKIITDGAVSPENASRWP